MTNAAHAEYARIEAVNWSTLKLMGRSPAHYHHALLQPQEDTTALRIGRAIHMAVFEPEKFASCVARWEGGTRRGKDWDVFCADHKGMDILTEAEHDLCLSVGQAVRIDASAKQYVTGGRGELTVRWNHHHEPSQTDIACKCRLDFVADAGVICDLKSTMDASPGAFGRQAYRLGYHGQAAWYRDGYAAATGRDLPVVIVAVEKQAPFAVKCYRVTEKQLQLGRDMYRGHIDLLAHCRAHSDWPAYGPESDLELPAWASDDDEADNGDDLVF